MKQEQIHILLIEDDPDDIGLIGKALSESRGGDPAAYSFECMPSLVEGLTALGRRCFDLVLLDITLTGVHGVEPLNRLRSEFPEIPVVALTNHEDEKLAVDALSGGAQDYLVKRSFDDRLLKRSIRYAIERHHLTAKLERSSEERFRQIFEKSADGMIVVNTQGDVAFLNPAVEAIFERDNADIIGKRFDFHVLARRSGGGETNALDDLSLKYVALLARTGKNTELEISLEGNVVKLVEMRATAITWEKRDAWLVVFHDITSLMRLQRLKAEIFERERVAKLKDEFISTVSHELRTPLAIVKCAVENMKDGVIGELSSKQDRIVKIACANVDRLTKLIDDILDLSRLEAGTVRITRHPVPLDQLVHDTVRRFTLLAQEHGVTLVPNVQFGLDPVHADIDKINQVLDNLIGNAIRFARHRVTVRVQSIGTSVDGKSMGPLEDFIARGGDGVLVSVIDDGNGIPGEKLGQLFSKFVQIDRPSGGAGYKGTGLGLAICKEIVELHDGRIWAESAPGDGARFHFVLPRRHATEEAVEGMSEAN